LTVNELLEALADPRFYVRFEALISIGRHGSDDQLNEALEEILLGSDPAMSVIAAWAMGRAQDNSLREPLRKALSSPYRSVRSHAARSLASIGDEDSIPLLASELDQETDFGLKVAYATSLGKLGDQDVIPELLNLLRKANFQASRQELALSLARLFDSEAEFIQLMRGVRADSGTIFSQNVYVLTKKFASQSMDDETIDLASQCAEAFAIDDLDTGMVLLSELANKLPKEKINSHHNAILSEGILQMKANKNELEYPILVILILHQI
jgi:HEAT repeat protein